MLLGRKTLGTVGYLGGVMTLPEPFVHSWTDMIRYNSQYVIDNDTDINYTRATVSYHSFARNMLVEHMQGDWLLQLDTDITFEPDLLGRMLNYLNNSQVKGKPVDVLVGMYLYKSPPHPPVAYGWDPKKKEKFILADWGKGDLIPIKGAGAGCLLVRKTVFDKIRTKLNCSPFDIYTDKDGSPHSEDHSFFERCWQLKIPVYAIPDVTVNHLMYKELDVHKDFDRDAQLTKRVDKFWK